MRISGEWYTCEDRIVRPVVRGELLGAGDTWVQTLFLLDTGADRTALSASVLAALNLDSIETGERLGGVGGLAESVAVETRIQLLSDDAMMIAFSGRYAAFTQLEALDMSILGRDILQLFAVIFDQSRDLVCMLRDRHHYTIAVG
ncbi:MAG: retropepsin-like domain-containing protein [Candidatus Tectomicrobia bacterium]|nr:retropepsin-like domain-containing protein [Candidatus Tectomicrobia bacterium]